MTERQKAILAFSDGRFFEGVSFGARGERSGEVVFNTSMTGYQEILTDPSYKGQIVTMTYPLIGNYGVNEEDFESLKPHVEGFVVRECCRTPSNWRATRTLSEFLVENDIIGIEGVDTRAITRHIRQAGALIAVISTEDLEAASLVAKAKASPGLIGRDLVKEVTCSEEYRVAPQGESRFRVVAFDFGIKRNILNSLSRRGCEIIVVPAQTTAAEALAHQPDGIFLSNGPGDPEGVPNVVQTVRELIERRPTFGICLGHQMLGLAFGAKILKLKFGHHGGNQPIKNLRTGRVEIAAENHGFAVVADTVPADVEVTHRNLNDNTVEGMRHRSLPVFSVQYHPEASPGPHDASYLFDRFIEAMENNRR
ncbi:MAG: carbamoyl-phosphate synthase small subunit [Candidatus Abyssobacteria bacterium SURF_5]|uniref:Carbamoyl phosphate synthase small chain n=1 Tax=Abyssobacteria bacterium (strain SURF_5) TaxID=2093360 RepID=A0A3A4NVN2_ABYX5|nr:MAG: carbamoyl-phosphate synthase small subunit [Candidatus Abyssubacteria bacterium SURF_5]